MRDSWVRQLIDVCLSENQRPYFCFLHVRQKIDTIRHDTPQRAHTSNTINDNCINLIRDNWSRVYSLGFFLLLLLFCVLFVITFFLKNIFLWSHFIVVMLFNSFFYQLLLFLMFIVDCLSEKFSEKSMQSIYNCIAWLV